MALPKRVFILPNKPSCIRCHTENGVIPGLSRVGQFLEGINFLSKEVGSQIVSLNPFQTAPVTRKMGFLSYSKKGLLCDTCASDYRIHYDSRGNAYPFVKTDPTPGFLNETVKGHGIKADKQLI